MRTSDLSPAQIKDWSDFENDTILFNQTLSGYHPIPKKVRKTHFQQLIRNNRFNLDTEFLKGAYQNPNVQKKSIELDGTDKPKIPYNRGLGDIFKSKTNGNVTHSVCSLLFAPVNGIQSVLRSFNPGKNVSTQPFAETDDIDYPTTQYGHSGVKNSDYAQLYLTILQRLKNINEKLEETPVCQESNISSDDFDVNDIRRRLVDAEQHSNPASTDSSVTTNVYVNNLYNLVESDTVHNSKARLGNEPIIDENTLALLQQVISQLDDRLQISLFQNGKLSEDTDNISKIEQNTRNRISSNQICKEFLKHVDTPKALGKGCITSDIYFKLGFSDLINPYVSPRNLNGKLSTPLGNFSTDLIRNRSSFQRRGETNDSVSSSKKILTNAVSYASELETTTEVSPRKEIFHKLEEEPKSEDSKRQVTFTGSFVRNSNRYDIDLIEKEYNSEMSYFSPKPKTKDPEKQNNPIIELEVGKAPDMNIIEKTYALLGTQPIGKRTVIPKTPITIEENQTITITSPKKRCGTKDKLAHTLPNSEKLRNGNKLSSLAIDRSGSGNGAIKIQTTVVGVTRADAPTTQKKSVKTADNVFLYRWK